ncbi:MAG: hypothetical protein Q7T80_11430 [Methanoregula sp.]|nr:hypothetical protein [Methanoregula sp.]
METIQIQFKESDYKVYYDYCLKYYQIHDTVRKQSIHAFLDLFEKDLIIVEAQDIGQVSLLLTRKCEDLKAEQKGTGHEGDNLMLLKTRACADLLMFCADLEKIYRLIQKQGIIANYLMILGTFSRVIEENRNSCNISMYDIKPDVLESLASPLVDIIRLKLGTDRQWRSVLQELAVIATRFNQRTSEPKFDLDIIQLVAPAVVSHFNKDVGTREILSVLPSYFDESELEEFEAFLNQTADLSKDDQDAAINWGTINEPLEVVARAVAAQREQWSMGGSKISPPSLLSNPLDIPSSEGIKTQAGSLSQSFSGLPQSGSNKKINIVVSPGITTQVESSYRVYSESDTAVTSMKVRVQPFIPVIIGVAVIILFIIGTLIVSGNWNIMGAGNTTNSTTGVIKNITNSSVKTTIAKNTTAKPSVTPKPNTTTVIIVVTPTLQSYSSVDIGNHLIEIAFGPDSNAIKKPTKELITIGCVGMYEASDLVLLQDFINEFNAYSSTTKISENIQLAGAGDIPLQFIPDNQISQIQQDKILSMSKDVNTGTYYFVNTGEITGAKTYVNSDLKGNERQRWILRSVLYNLGFLGETAKYPNSIFYYGSNNVTQMNAIDLKALQLMFGKKVTNGMTRANLKAFI